LDIDLEITGCVGMCHLEPIVDIYYDDHNFDRFVKVKEDEILELINNAKEKNILEEKKIAAEDEEALTKQVRIAIENCGLINPERIEEYISKGGYQALEKCLTQLNPDEIIEEIKISGLRGRGGAGFPTWFKWNAAKMEKVTPKYMVCNADEGDPGAFIDRSILEGDPHRVLEGMIIGGYDIGSEEGIIYV
ncbi:NADH-quinone oxidoreductase subunit F, partial [Vibrio parahaemolyticus]|nr:NADH-quinone oxidoreductase subunit L [Vibrio parahaemolyticus]NMR96693.1 NADH-quinone oxidoreductase subunit F [Vibrio parahaemolyticus]